jgi:hypothetical protein
MIYFYIVPMIIGFLFILFKYHPKSKLATEDNASKFSYIKIVTCSIIMLLIPGINMLLVFAGLVTFLPEIKYIIKIKKWLESPL